MVGDTAGVPLDIDCGACNATAGGTVPAVLCRRRGSGRYGNRR